MHVGPNIGPAIGPRSDATDPMEDVTLDVAANRYVPASAAEWTTTRAAAGISSGNPSHLWPLQDTATFDDAIGAAPLTTVGTVAAQQAATGWTRLGAKATNAAGAIYADVNGNFSTASGLALMYITVGSNPGAEKRLTDVGAASKNGAGLIPGPKLRATSGGLNPTDGVVNYSGIVPVITKYDKTNSVLKVYSHQEIISSTFTAQGAVNEDLIVFLGDGASLSTDSVCVYAALFKGSAAELSDASIRSLLQTLGWTVAW